jgi:polysaccharide biosynthesis/export protein
LHYSKQLILMKIPSGNPYGKLLLILFVAVLSSCVTQKQVKYLQKLQKEDTTSTFVSKWSSSSYKIQPHDNLYIRVVSLDEKSGVYFNKQTGANQSGYEYANDAAIYLSSYSVDDSGYVALPVVGKLYLRDLTLEQAKRLVQSMVDEYLKETIVIMKLVNFNITVVGEVRKPGQIKVYQDKITIFETLSMAGDLTDFADRARISLIRQERGKSRVIQMNLNSDKILNSEYYYMRPNDIIYVAPLGLKRWGFETFPWLVVLTAISTTILLANYIKTY